jgi:hypothetical protein
MTRNKLKYCTLGATAIALITMAYFEIPVFREVYGSLCCYLIDVGIFALALIVRLVYFRESLFNPAFACPVLDPGIYDNLTWPKSTLKRR